MASEIRVPTLGESVTEATVGTWLKKEGEAVKADEPLVELETEKVTLEVPAPAAGILGPIKAKNGDVVGVGAMLGSIVAGSGAAKAAPEMAKGSAGAAGRPDAKTETTAPIAAGPEEMIAAPVGRKKTAPRAAPRRPPRRS